MRMNLLVITQKVDNDDDIMGFFHGWLRELAPLVDELDVITLYRGAVDLPDNVHVYSLGKENGDPKWLWGIRFYLRLLRRLPRADGVFCHMSPDYVLALYPLNVVFSKPVILWYAHVRVSGRAAWAARHVDRVFSPSRESFAHESGNLVEAGHGIDTKRFRPPDDSPVAPPIELLSVNRISPVKDIDVLLEAVRVLVHEMNFHDFRVSILGGPANPEDHAYAHELEQRASSYGIEPYVNWVGSVAYREIPRHLQRSHALVRTQGGGGFSKHELEALACGVPAIVCAPVYREVYADFATSLCWKEKDPRDLAEKIRVIANWSADERSRFSKWARNYVETHHDLKKLAQKIVDELKSAGSM